MEELKYLSTEHITFFDLGHKDAELRKLKQDIAELRVLAAKQASEIMGLKNEAERLTYLKKRSEIELLYDIVPGSKWGYSPETGEIDCIKG